MAMIAIQDYIQAYNWHAGDEEESGGNWLSLLGIGQKTTYADDE